MKAEALVAIQHSPFLKMQSRQPRSNPKPFMFASALQEEPFSDQQTGMVRTKAKLLAVQSHIASLRKGRQQWFPAPRRE